jgi:hypothetical protein
MKKNFLQMVGCCLGLLMFTSVSCATKNADEGYSAAGEAVESEMVDSLAEAPDGADYPLESAFSMEEPAMNGGEEGRAGADETALSPQVPNVSVNVVQVNNDENSPASQTPAGLMAGSDHQAAPLRISEEFTSESAKTAESGAVKDQRPAAVEPVNEVRFAKIERVPTQYNVYQYMPDASKSLGTETILSEMSKEVAGKIFYELKDEGEKNFTAKIAVVNAVPLSDLKRETEFGRIVGEYLLTDLADRGLKVTELRMGREINILPQTGEFIMSRNIGELANNAPELDYVVITTFSNTRKTLIVQGRLVGLQDGLVKTSWRYGLPLNRELLGLFHTVEAPFKIAVKGIGQ